MLGTLTQKGLSLKIQKNFQRTRSQQSFAKKPMENPQLGRLVVDPDYEGRRVIEGYLRKMKQGGKKMFGKTTKRWFILNLNRGIFGYKEKEKASVLKGAFDLRDLEYIQEGPSSETKKTDDGFYFGVCFRDREFEFIAENRHELQMWLQGFTAIRIEMPAKSSSSSQSASVSQMPKVKDQQLQRENTDARIEEAKLPREIHKRQQASKAAKEILKDEEAKRKEQQQPQPQPVPVGKPRADAMAKKKEDPPTDEEGVEQEDLDFKKTPAPQAPAKNTAALKRKEIELKEESKRQAPQPSAKAQQAEKVPSQKPAERPSEKVQAPAAPPKAEVKAPAAPAEKPPAPARPMMEVAESKPKEVAAKPPKAVKTYTTALDQVADSVQPTVKKVHLEEAGGGLNIHGGTSAMVVTLKNRQKKKREQIEEIIDDELPSSGGESSNEEEKKAKVKQSEKKKREQKQRLLMQQAAERERHKLDEEIMQGLGQKSGLVKALNPSVIKRKEKPPQDAAKPAAVEEAAQPVLEPEEVRSGPAKLAMGFLDLMDQKEVKQHKEVAAKGWGAGQAEKENNQDEHLSDWDDSPQRKPESKKRPTQQQQKEEDFDYDWDDEDEDEIASPPKKARKVAGAAGGGGGLAIARAESPLEDWD